MLVVVYQEERPGPGWHRHGTTDKLLWILRARRLLLVRLRKQRWLHVATGTTRHDRPVWDRPGSSYGLDVVVLLLTIWLCGPRGLHAIDWPWEAPRPSRRTVQRWATTLAPVAETWLQAARERILEHVAPRPLEALLPTGGIPPPTGRSRSRQAEIPQGSKLREVVWIHENVARALSIPIRRLLVVARWRWPSKLQIHRLA